MPRVIANALADISAGLRLRRVWWALASEDIGDQHRRTALGPLWLLINYLAFAGTFIFVFRPGVSGTANYAAYVATGLLVWFYIMETLTQSVSLFLREESFIKGTTLPISVYVLRLTAQSVIRAAYALVGCIAILLMSGVAFSVAWTWSLLGLVLVVATTPAAIVLFAFVGAYFPDSQFVVSNLMRIGMFLTPVFWVHAGGGGVRGAFYYWNPFTYFLEIVRIPILSGELPARSFLLCLAISLALWAVALMLLGRYRKQLVFVL
jgi:ABC-type polysaccharide/polyol phosphate export permease